MLKFADGPADRSSEEASMRKTMAVALVGGMLFAATPASARTIVVGRDRTTGDNVSVNAVGDAHDPEALFVKVKTRPTDQRVRVIWNVFCSNPSGSSSTSGSFYRRTTVYERVRMPYANPDFCRLTATVQRTVGGGSLILVLLARV
jgi:hypothetical protein